MLILTPGGKRSQKVLLVASSASGVISLISFAADGKLRKKFFQIREVEPKQIISFRILLMVLKVSRASEILFRG